MISSGQLRKGKKASYLVTCKTKKVGELKPIYFALNLLTGINIPINSRFESGTELTGIQFVDTCMTPQTIKQAKVHDK